MCLFCIKNRTAREFSFFSMLTREIPGPQVIDIDTIADRNSAFFKNAREQTWVEILVVVIFHDATSYMFVSSWAAHTETEKVI